MIEIVHLFAQIEINENIRCHSVGLCVCVTQNVSERYNCCHFTGEKTTIRLFRMNVGLFMAVLMIVGPSQPVLFAFFCPTPCTFWLFPDSLRSVFVVCLLCTNGGSAAAAADVVAFNCPTVSNFHVYDLQ